MSRFQRAAPNTRPSTQPSAPVSKSSTPSGSSNMISVQSAVYMLNKKIQSLEETLKEYITQIETKMGEQDAYVSENIPDLDQINNAFKDVNKRILDFESFEARISALEKKMNVDAPPKKQRGGTIKLQEQPSDANVGISFSS